MRKLIKKMREIDENSGWVSLALLVIFSGLIFLALTRDNLFEPMLKLLLK